MTGALADTNLLSHDSLPEGGAPEPLAKEGRMATILGEVETSPQDERSYRIIEIDGNKLQVRRTGADEACRPLGAYS
jgi:hypothetical protein